LLGRSDIPSSIASSHKSITIYALFRGAEYGCGAYGCNCQKAKVIFATNRADTSVTIHHIEHVIDCGSFEERIFDPELSEEVVRECWLSITQMS
jgi:hypothetical protein